MGFIPDFGAMASVMTAMFVEGEPKARASMWQRIRKGHGVEKWPEENAWALTALRCGDCGKVEMYATERPDPALTAQPLG